METKTKTFIVKTREGEVWVKGAVSLFQWTWIRRNYLVFGQESNDESLQRFVESLTPTLQATFERS